MFTEYLYKDALTESPKFIRVGDWLGDLELFLPDVSNRFLFIGSKDDWNTFKGYLTLENIIIKPTNWHVFSELDSHVIKTYSTVWGNLFFYSRIEYVNEYMAKHNKKVTDDL